MHCPTMESINGNCPGMWIINVIKSGKCPLHTQMVFDFISYPHDVHHNKTVNDSPPSRIFADLLSPGHSTLWFVSVQVLSLPEVTQLRHGSTNPHLFGYQIGSVETFGEITIDCLCKFHVPSLTVQIWRRIFNLVVLFILVSMRLMGHLE